MAVISAQHHSAQRCCSIATQTDGYATTSATFFNMSAGGTDGFRTQNIARICLNMDGQKNTSDNTTHLHWKTIPTKLHLEKGDDARRTGILFLKKRKEGKQGPVRQRPDFREAKEVHRQLYKEHAESIGEGVYFHPSSTPSKTKLSTTIQRLRGVQLYGSPSNWMDTISFNKFVFILARAAARRLVSRIKVGIIGDLQPGLNSNNI